MMSNGSGELIKNFDRQVNNLLQKGYADAAGLPAEEFLAHIEPLRLKLADLVAPEVDLEAGRLPFVIVIKSDLVGTDAAMALVEREGKRGVIKLYPHEPKDFLPIQGALIPKAKAYLLIDIDRGKDTINLPPSEAMKLIVNDNRLPLTIDEGVAIVTQFPDFLRKNSCFSLLASRHSGDKRVPAIWINGQKCPNLGWCWDGNPHTWLGSASGGSRF